jgi:hypothetical protein
LLTADDVRSLHAYLSLKQFLKLQTDILVFYPYNLSHLMQQISCMDVFPT